MDFQPGYPSHPGGTRTFLNGIPLAWCIGWSSQADPNGGSDNIIYTVDIRYLIPGS